MDGKLGFKGILSTQVALRYCHKKVVNRDHTILLYRQAIY